MADQFAWLSQTDWAAVSALASAATFVGGVIAVLAAFRQIQSSRRIHDDQVRPYVIIDIEPSPSWWMLHDLVIRNIGQTAAIDCKITLDPKPTRTVDQGTDTLQEAKVLNEPIAMLAPGREIRIFFDDMRERIQTNLPMEYSATITYRSHATGESWKETYLLDAAALKGTENIEIYTIHHAAKALKDLQKDLHNSKLLKGVVEVLTETRADNLERRRREREDQIRDFRRHTQGPESAKNDIANDAS